MCGSALTQLSGAHSKFDFSSLMAKKIPLSLNFETNQLMKEMSVLKSDPQYLIRIPSSTKIVGQKQENDHDVNGD
jgi:hypothetical protein